MREKMGWETKIKFRNVFIIGPLRKEAVICFKAALPYTQTAFLHCSLELLAMQCCQHLPTSCPLVPLLSLINIQSGSWTNAVQERVVHIPFCFLMKRLDQQLKQVSGAVPLLSFRLPVVASDPIPHQQNISLGFCVDWELVAPEGLGYLFCELAKEKLKGAQRLLKMQNQCKGHTHFQDTQKSMGHTVSEVEPWTPWKPQWPWRRTWTRPFGIRIPWVDLHKTLWLPGERERDFLDKQVKLIKMNAITKLPSIGGQAPGGSGRVSLIKALP